MKTGPDGLTILPLPGDGGLRTSGGVTFQGDIGTFSFDLDTVI
jgi:hypothetical protein